MRLGLAAAAVLSLLLVLSTEILAAAPPFQDQLYEITSPRANAEVRGSVDIVGSAQLGPEFQFYKVEYASSAKPDLWVAIGDIHRQERINTTLEVWHTTSVPDGAYYVHLVVVKQDGNLVETDRIPVRVANTESAPTPTPEETPTPTPTVVVPTPTTATVEQPTVVRANPTATSADGEPSPTTAPEEEPASTVTIPSLGAFVRQFLFGAFVAAVLFVFVGVVFLLRRFI
jgi:methionine-rich copper-binding protein CopC